MFGSASPRVVQKEEYWEALCDVILNEIPGTRYQIGPTETGYFLVRLDGDGKLMPGWEWRVVFDSEAPNHT
jgi:hypothetical protein